MHSRVDRPCWASRKLTKAGVVNNYKRPPAFDEACDLLLHPTNHDAPQSSSYLILSLIFR